MKVERAWAFAVVGAALSAVGAACSSEGGGAPAPAGVDASTGGSDASPVDGATADAGVDAGAARASVVAVFDLPRAPATQGLSSTFYDEANGFLYALSDLTPSITPIEPSKDWKTWTPRPPLDLVGRPGATWDGEGLARAGGRFVAVTVETTPLVETFDDKGTYQGVVPIPAVFAQQRAGNKGLESLAASPDGAWLFSANEQALTVDGAGPTRTEGSLVRILRLEVSSSATTQAAYRTEPLGPGTGGDMGVSELAALSPTRLLVLERGFQSDVGNTVKIFEIDLAGAVDVSGSAALSASSPVVAKSLVVDLGTLPDTGVTHPGTQVNKLLDNYESLSVGPTLPDGRRLLFLTSDDNAQTTQVARVLVLAVRGL
ncbi:MAG: esterase-like activity of phytase family protein [Myxococcales bacterium]|nr:esterase-like activity of phytase family protein [Myxococcales bacterium]